MTETEKVELAIKHLNGHSTEANTVLMLKCIASSLAKIADNMETKNINYAAPIYVKEYGKEEKEGNFASFEGDNRWGLNDEKDIPNVFAGEDVAYEGNDIWRVRP